MASPGRKRRVSDDEIMEVLARAETPVLTTSDVADELPIGRRAVLDRLDDLRDRGRLESMDVGPKARVWWLAEGDNDRDSAPAAPLRSLVGMVPEDAAERARDRSREWRDEFDREMADDAAT